MTTVAITTATIKFYIGGSLKLALFGVGNRSIYLSRMPSCASCHGAGVRNWLTYLGKALAGIHYII